MNATKQRKEIGESFCNFGLYWLGLSSRKWKWQDHCVGWIKWESCTVQNRMKFNNTKWKDVHSFYFVEGDLQASMGLLLVRRKYDGISNNFGG